MNASRSESSLFSASACKRAAVVSALFATLVIAGCSSKPPQDFSQIENNINTAAAPEFGACIEYSNAAANDLATARELLAKGKEKGRLNDDDFQAAVNASQSAVANRERAEQACHARLAALEQRLQRTKEVLRGVTFATGSAELSQKARENLRLVANRLLREPTRVEILGHTSSTGALDFNMKLSQARADSVRSFLISQGVPADSITARGFGPNQPVASNETEEGRRANQRIEIVYEREIQ